MNVNGNEIILYESIESMPILRKNAFDRYAMLDAGIGSGLEDIDNHISIVSQYITKGMEEEAKKELLNYRQNLFFALEQISPKNMSFVPLIKSINGKRIDDISEVNAKKILEDLNKKGLTYGALNGAVERVKKKLKAKLKYFFRQ